MLFYTNELEKGIIEVKIVLSSYQKGALVTMLTAAIWGSLFIVRVHFKITSFFEIPVIIIWMVVLLYTIRIMWSYILGIAGSMLIILFDMYIYPIAPVSWWTINTELGIFHITLYLILIGNLYFSYKAFKEKVSAPYKI